LLHTLGVVDFSGTAIVEGENSDCLVEGGGDEFSASWCEIDIQNCLNVIFVYHFGLGEISHIKGVAITVLISYHKIHRLIRIPGDSTTLILESYSLESSFTSDVEQANTSIKSSASDQINF